MTVEAAIAKLQSGDFHMSYSSLKAFMKSPRSLISYMTEDFEGSPAMMVGKAIHCLVLEGEDVFNDRYREKAAKATGTGSMAINAAYEAGLDRVDASGNEIIWLDKVLIADIRRRADIVLKNYPCKKLLEECDCREVEIKWEHQGIQFLGYVDLMAGSALTFGELKTCTDARQNKIMYQIKDLKYYVQVAMYRDAIKQRFSEDAEAVSMFLDDNDVGVYQWHYDFIDQGYKEYDSACEDLKRMIDRGFFWSSLDFFSKTRGIYLLEKPSYM